MSDYLIVKIISSCGPTMNTNAGPDRCPAHASFKFSFLRYDSRIPWLQFPWPPVHCCTRSLWWDRKCIILSDHFREHTYYWWGLWGGGSDSIISVCTIIWLSEAAGSLGWNNMQVEGEGSVSSKKPWESGLGGWGVCVCACVCVCAYVCVESGYTVCH